MPKKLAAALASLLLLASCTRTDDPAHGAAPKSDVEQTRPAILKGTPSDETQDATVMLYFLDPVAKRLGGLCTATMIAPRLVLTARHCVAVTDLDVACEADGTPVLGAKIKENHNAQDLYVFTGKDRPAFAGDAPPELDTTKWQPAGRGAEIIDDHSGTLCNHDIALVLLENPIPNVKLASIATGRDAKAGELLLTVGWGVATSEVEPKVRQQRRDVHVKRVGPNTSVPVLTKSEFLFDESICLGDSGGPVFSQKTGAVLGVVSRGGNGADPSGGGPAFTCVDADNIATKLSPFPDLFKEGFDRAGAQPITEPPEDDDNCGVAAPGSRPARAGWVALGLALGAAAWIRRRKTS